MQPPAISLNPSFIVMKTQRVMESLTGPRAFYFSKVAETLSRVLPHGQYPAMAALLTLLINNQSILRVGKENWLWVERTRCSTQPPYSGVVDLHPVSPR